MEYNINCMQNKGIGSDELLSFLDFSLKELSPRADELLTEMVKYKLVTNLQILTPMSLYCWYANIRLEQMEYNSQILFFEQNIKNMKSRLEKNKEELKIFLEDLKIEKEKFKKEDITDEFVKQECLYENKIKNYEETLSDLNMRLSCCHIPPEVMPHNIKKLKEKLLSKKMKHDELKILVDRIEKVKSAKKDLMSLKNKEFYK